MLLLEIIFARIAWQRGWKAWALLPLAIDMGIGFLYGLFVKSCGRTSLGSDEIMMALAGDVVTVIVLVVMAIKGKHAAVSPAAELPQSP